jgi:hypothetical protein
MGAVRRAGYTENMRLRHMDVLPVLPQFPAELERGGITDLDRNRYYHPEMHERLRSLHICSCLASPPTAAHPPGFYVYPEATGAWVGDREEIRLLCLAGPVQDHQVYGRLTAVLG